MAPDLQDGKYALDPKVDTMTMIRIDIMISSLSLAGSGFMILSFLVNSHHRSRRQLIFGLAVADFCQANSVLIPSAYTLAINKYYFPAGKACNVSGYLYPIFTFASTLWILLLAISTAFLLMKPVSRHHEALNQVKWLIPSYWVGIYGTSILYVTIWWSILGRIEPLGGGMCDLRSSSNTGLPGSLILFLPRAITFLVISFVYALILNFLRRRSIDSNAGDCASSKSTLCCSPPPFECPFVGLGGRTTVRRLESGWPGDIPDDVFCSGMDRLRGVDTIESDGTLVGESTEELRKMVQDDREKGRETTLCSDGSLRSDSLPSVEPPIRSSVQDEHRDADFARNSQVGQTSQKRKHSPAEMSRNVPQLMMLYPIAYLLLIPLSLIREAYQLAEHERIPYLSAIGRFLIFSQGFVHAIIYALVEYGFRNSSGSVT
ncbi:hypothetical protein BT69DRAFT_1350355 [Atractiella rhizophila]|nr:hypothetical protein BT69DRAFT_1350355 [Atractiella rhizophila]